MTACNPDAISAADRLPCPGWAAARNVFSVPLYFIVAPKPHLRVHLSYKVQPSVQHRFMLYLCLFSSVPRRISVQRARLLTRHRLLWCYVSVLSCDYRHRKHTPVNPGSTTYLLSLGHSLSTRELLIDCNLDWGSRLRASRSNTNSQQVQQRMHMLGTF